MNLNLFSRWCLKEDCCEGPSRQPSSKKKANHFDLNRELTWFKKRSCFELKKRGREGRYFCFIFKSALAYNKNMKINKIFGKEYTVKCVFVSLDPSMGLPKSVPKFSEIAGHVCWGFSYVLCGTVGSVLVSVSVSMLCEEACLVLLKPLDWRPPGMVQLPVLHLADWCGPVWSPLEENELHS